MTALFLRMKKRRRNEELEMRQMKTSKFKMTELGPIPEDWEVKKIEDFYDVGSSKRVFQSQWRSSGIPFYRARDIVGFRNGEDAVGGLYIDKSLYEAYKRSYGVPIPGDLLVTAVGTLGKVFRVIDETPFYFKDGNIIWFRGRGEYDSRLLEQLFDSGWLDSQIYDTAGGSTVGTYTITNAKKTLIPCPHLLEQERIAEALSDVDALLSAMTTLIEKKRAIKQGAMQELLGMRNAKCGMRNTPRRRLAGFSGEWVEKRLGKIASFETATIGIDKIDSEWYIGTENMLAEKAGVEKNLTPVPYATVREYKVGDVLISNIRPYLKKIWLADRDGGCSTDVLVVRTIDNRICLPMFLKMLLSDDSFFDFTMANAVGTKMPRGDKKVIVNYEVHLPTLAEQQAIAAVLSDMDAEIAALEAKRAKYENIKQGMMQELLTGKTRLKGE